MRSDERDDVKRRSGGLAPSVGLALVLTACAGAKQATSQTGSAGVLHGRIAAARTVGALPAAQLQVIVTALSEPEAAAGASAAPDPLPPAAIEYIVRQDGGRTISIVESAAASGPVAELQPGDKVVVVPNLAGNHRSRVLPDS